MAGMGHGEGMMTWWMSGWGWFWALLLAAAIIAVIVTVASRATRGAGTAADDRQRRALKTLEERFARGEIDDEEFHRRRAALRDERS